jgi:hypothetical protein
MLAATLLLIVQAGAVQPPTPADTRQAGLAKTLERLATLEESFVRQYPDTATTESARGEVARSRAKVLDALALAADSFPEDDWITGRRVRFLIDQGDNAAATAVARNCRATRWWCMALSGLVAYRRGNVVDGENEMARAAALAPADVRCGLTSAADLLLAEDWSRYARVGCDIRGALDSKLWWLADPEYRVPGNERRAEHFARGITLLLRSSAELKNLCMLTGCRRGVETNASDADGAIREVFVRYGPLGPNRGGPDRLHTIPAWSAVNIPYLSRPGDWELDAAAAKRTRSDAVAWKPRELYAPSRGTIVQLPNPQFAAFRREDSVTVALALDVPADVARAARGTSARGAIVISTMPDVFDVRETRATVGQTMRTAIPTTTAPQIVSVELGTGASVMARARFAITPLVHLARANRKVGISDIALLRVPPTTTYPTDLESMLPYMLPTTDLRGLDRVGLYWETYDVGPRDTVDISIRVDQQLEPPNFLERIGRALRLASRPIPGLAQKWRQAGTGPTPAVPNSIPTLAKALTLDLSRLSPGMYRVTVTVARAGIAQAVTTRPFTIAR